jgi:hypothetical protein
VGINGKFALKTLLLLLLFLISLLADCALLLLVPKLGLIPFKSTPKTEFDRGVLLLDPLTGELLFLESFNCFFCNRMSLD